MYVLVFLCKQPLYCTKTNGSLQSPTVMGIVDLVDNDTGTNNLFEKALT